MSELLVFLSKLLISSVFAYFFEKNQQFPEKTDERIPNPDFNKQKEEENILTGYIFLNLHNSVLLKIRQWRRAGKGIV